MHATTPFLDLSKLIEILSFTKTATAVHLGEDARIQFANDAMIKIWGKDRSVIGLSLEDALPELKGQPFIEMFARVWREGLTISGSDTPAELIIDGAPTIIYFDFEYRAILDDNRQTICILHTAVDVTERFLKENAIVKAAETEKVLAREQALNEELSATNEELTATNEELANAFAALHESNQELERTRLSLQLLNEQLDSKVKDRLEIISYLNQELEASNEEIKASNEELAASNEELYATNEELSENRDRLAVSLKNLSDSEFRTRTIIESAPFPIAVYTGREMRVTFANQAIIEVWGKGNDVIGKLYREILPELDNQSVFDQLNQVFTTGISFEARNQRLDLVVSGAVKTSYFNYNFTALKNGDGEIYGVMNTAADVSDIVLAKKEVEQSAEKLAEVNEEMAAINEELTASNEDLLSVNQQLVKIYSELSASQDELQLAIDAAELGTFDLDPISGKFKGNERIRHWFGLQPEEEIALAKATAVISESDRERVVAAIDFAMNPSSGGDYDTHYSITQPDGNRAVIVRAKGKALFDQLGNAVRLSGVLQDITEQVKSRAVISDMNTRLNIALEAASLGSTEVDLATGKMDCNDQFKLCFGREIDQEFTYPELFEAMLPEYRDDIKAQVRYAKENRTVYKAEYQIRWPNGSIHWINAHGRARYDEQGNAVKMVGIIHDITEAKADEQRKNDFIGMVSHELKTPLTSLTAYVQLLSNKAKKDGDKFVLTALEKANNQAKKMASMINSFLNVSRLESGKIHIEKQHFDLSLLIREIEEEFGFTANNHQFSFDFSGALFIHADREKIGHVISNLISNAVKYSPAGTLVKVRCKVKDGEVIIEVEDEGSGIKEADLDKLFDRYYRVKDQPLTVSGFGIGLYLCAEIIKRHDGKIWVESRPGEGSTFFFSLCL